MQSKPKLTSVLINVHEVINRAFVLSERDGLHDMPIARNLCRCGQYPELYISYMADESGAIASPVEIYIGEGGGQQSEDAISDVCILHSDGLMSIRPRR